MSVRVCVGGLGLGEEWGLEPELKIRYLLVLFI